MKKIIYGIIIIILILLIVVLLFFIKKGDNDNNTNNEVPEINSIQNVLINEISENIIVQNELLNESENEDMEEIKNMQDSINSSANPNIYFIDEEYDGRKILQIRPAIQYEVDLAGILKNGKPEENEIGNLLRSGPRKSGIWISEQSRQSFINLLRDNNLNNFYISEDGYLQVNNNIDDDLANKLINMINSNKLYIVNMNGIAYERDYISGKITEYPFEDMDPYQIIQPYTIENSTILEITSNKSNKLTNKEILEAVVTY